MISDVLQKVLSIRTKRACIITKFRRGNDWKIPNVKEAHQKLIGFSLSKYRKLIVTFNSSYNPFIIYKTRNTKNIKTIQLTISIHRPDLWKTKYLLWPKQIVLEKKLSSKLYTRVFAWTETCKKIVKTQDPQGNLGFGWQMMNKLSTTVHALLRVLVRRRNLFKGEILLSLFIHPLLIELKRMHTIETGISIQ